MTPECPLCGGTRDYLRLELSASQKWWELKLSSDPSVSIGSPRKQPRGLAQIQICEYGHFWPLEVDRVNVVRLLGTTAAGKTVLLRNLNHQVVPGLVYHEPPRLCTKAFDGTRHPEPTPKGTLRHYTILNDLLEQDYEATPGLLADFLKNLDIDPELWGGDQRSPYHLITSDERGVLDTVFIDHPGEAMRDVYGNTSGQDASDLQMSDGLAWVVDTALFPAVQREVQRSGTNGRDILLESLAPNRHTGKHLDEVVAGQGDRYVETGQLSRLFAMNTERIAPAVFRATILTKADLILHLLQNAKDSGTPGWHGFASDGKVERFHKRFVRAGVQFLQSYVKHRRTMAVDAPTDQVLAYLDSARPDIAERLFERVVERVLSFYSEPDRFAELILDEEPGVDAGRPFMHEIECGPTVRLQIAPMATGWKGYRNQQSVQHRDLAVGIIARGVLGADSSLGRWIEQAESTHVIHYFLTAPLVAADQVRFPTFTNALAETPGVQHLLAWSIR